VQEHPPVDSEAVKGAKGRRATNHGKSLMRLALRKHQESWVQERRDWKILTRGKEQSLNQCRNDLVNNPSLLVSERERLA
jgi:hypothetical protein